MDWAEWVWRRERDALWSRISGGAQPESDSRSVGAGTVVLEAAVVVDGDVPVVACGRALTAALAAGWEARVTRAVAAVPRTGLLTTYALRARRHDERLWACWWNGSFNSAQYWRAGQSVESLGWRTVVKRRGVLDAIEGLHLARHLVSAT